MSGLNGWRQKVRIRGGIIDFFTMDGDSPIGWNCLMMKLIFDSEV